MASDKGRRGVAQAAPAFLRNGDLQMDLRLGDLYDLVVRVVDERLRQWRLNGSGLPAGDAEPNSLTVPSRSETGQTPPSEWQALAQQLGEVVALQRQVLAALLQYQQRTEALLDELAGALAQLLGHQRGDSRHLPTASGGETETVPPPRSVKDGASQTEKPSAYPSALAPSVEPAVYVPAGEATVPPAEAVDGASVNWAELLVTYLQQAVGVQVQYLRERQMPATLEAGGGKVLVGEALRNGQAVTIAALHKDHITAPDVSIFYNAIIKPLRASVTEPVIGVVIGQQFDPKADRVAYAHELIALTIADLLSKGAAS
ncbi:hypothetical protein HRbin17_01762 [bacterium HR17]|uniref:Uncharacterized protein n=1 Tax=Candidatus Fervidibacter japonicus TaxID=2035412 RepID=A0A2H5XDI5_9BACT|nr:hypothetical protein HRbin17_01762 [bacterium HR17]